MYGSHVARARVSSAGVKEKSLDSFPRSPTEISSLHVHKNKALNFKLPALIPKNEFFPIFCN